MKDKNNDSQFYIERKKTNIFDVLKNEFKQATFSILFVLLKDQEDISNMLFFAVPIIIDYIQVLNFIFHDKIKSLWNSKKLFLDMMNIFAFFDLSRFYGGVINWNLYLIFFYFFILLIFFIIIDIIYVSYSFRKKQFSVIWPLTILRNFVNLAVTILFLFITEILLSMIECDHMEDKEGYFHKGFPDVQCFVGVHLIHTVFAIVFNLAFVFISLIVTLNLYESRISSENKQARSNSRADVSFIVNKIVLQICFGFIDNVSFLIFITFFGGVVMAYYYIYDDPFYNKVVGNLFKVLNGFYLWSCFCLVILNFLKAYNFDAGIILWISPLPFILFISITFTKRSINNFLKSELKFESSKELNDHCQFLIQLIEEQKTDKNSYLLLMGYIQKHKEICLEIDCPLKSTSKFKRNVNSDFNEVLFNLIQVINRLYTQGIKQFKKAVTLRIAFAFFLLEKMNDKKSALEELTIAEKLRPSFEEEFLIYRYKKIINNTLNDRRSEDVKEEEIDVVDIIAFETHLKTCIAFIKKSTEFHKEFWNELLKQKPSLTKMNNLGTKINFTIKNVKENWNKLIKINSHIPSVFKLYGQFLLNILNDTENGEKFVEQFNELVLKIYNSDINKKINYNGTYNKSGLMFAGFHKNEFGHIKKINKEFINMFKISKEEAINKKIEIIMPSIYSDNHVDFILNFIKNNQDKEVYFLKDNNFFGKDKNGFIFPILSNVKPYISENLVTDSLLFLNILKFNNKFKKKIFLITDKNGIIRDISSNSCLYLNLTLKKITERRISINNFLDKALVLHDYRTKGIEKIFESAQKKKFRTLNFVYPIMMKNLDPKNDIVLYEEKKLHGFLIIFEILSNRVNMNYNYITNLKKNNYHLKIPNKNFWNNIPLFQNQLNKIKMEKKTNITVIKEVDEFVEEKIFYFNNQPIITQRLIDGEITNLYEKKFFFENIPSKNSDYIKLNVKKSVFKDKLVKYEKQKVRSKKQTQKNLLKKIIVKEEKNPLIKFYKIFSISFLIIIILLNFLKYKQGIKDFKKIQNEIFLLEETTEILTSFSNILSDTYKLEFLERGISNQYKSFQKKELIREKLKKQINKNIYLIQNDFRHFKFYNKDHLEEINIIIDDERNKDEIYNIDYNNKTDFYDFIMYHEYKIYDFLSFFLYSLNQKKNDRNNFMFELKIIKKKLFEGFYFDYLKETQLLFDFFAKRYEKGFNINNLILIYLIVGLVIGITFLFYFFYLLKVIHKKIENILLLFLDIPRKHLEKINKKCENFLNFCKVN